MVEWFACRRRNCFCLANPPCFCLYCEIHTNKRSKMNWIREKENVMRKNREKKTRFRDYVRFVYWFFPVVRISLLFHTELAREWATVRCKHSGMTLFVSWAFISFHFDCVESFLNNGLSFNSECNSNMKNFAEQKTTHTNTKSVWIKSVRWWDLNTNIQEQSTIKGRK